MHSALDGMWATTARSDGPAKMDVERLAETFEVRRQVFRRVVPLSCGDKVVMSAWGRTQYAEARFRGLGARAAVFGGATTGGVTQPDTGARQPSRSRGEVIVTSTSTQQRDGAALFLTMEEWAAARAQ